MTEKSDMIQNQAGLNPEESLCDIVIPPGVPRSIILDIAKKFDVEVVTTKQKLHFANMNGDERELLAFRSTRAVAEEVQKYMIAEIHKFIGE